MIRPRRRASGARALRCTSATSTTSVELRIDPREDRHVDHGDRDQRDRGARSDDRDQGDREQQGRQRQQHVDGPHDDACRPIRRGTRRAARAGRRSTNARRTEPTATDERHAEREEDAREHVAAERIRAERVRDAQSAQHAARTRSRRDRAVRAAARRWRPAPGRPGSPGRCVPSAGRDRTCVSRRTVRGGGGRDRAHAVCPSSIRGSTSPTSDVREERHQDEQRRHHEDPALHDGVVALVDRRDDEPADPRQGEQRTRSRSRRRAARRTGSRSP